MILKSMVATFGYRQTLFPKLVKDHIFRGSWEVLPIGGTAITIRYLAVGQVTLNFCR